ncbi:molybdenum cofactor guanylyltransferase MobA [Paracoccus xiamenensis]|uniref:molybdenum cofactor guanylyltransferase MobA n=1 Tax=Paracoccus xiamenensis TaxID=2714901 RepID=UPI001409C19E|nr:molybdenum cofactor guanylyltransferase MobA [Paracoccus xiamenensis]NHF72738.1 molybdenum cofactor guanylyltransferase MobA [Paracoccus xiamenensis]
MRLPAVILAGGQSSRMGGGDKVLLTLGDRPMLAHVIARLAPQASPLAISANGDPARFERFGLPVLADSLPDHPGPLAGVLAAMDWAAGLGFDAVLTAAGDTPFPPDDLATGLQAAAGPRGLALAADLDQGAARLHPTFGLWPTALREDLRAALTHGQRRVRQWAAAYQAGTALFQGAEPFFNINTPDDLTRATTLLRGLSDTAR